MVTKSKTSSKSSSSKEKTEPTAEVKESIALVKGKPYTFRIVYN